MKTFLQRMFYIFTGLIGLLVMFHLIETWRGTRAMNKWRAESIAAGLAKTLEEMAPPRIPDAENFAMHPSIADAVAGRPEKEKPVLPTVISDGEIFRAWEKGQQIDLDALKAKLKVADLGNLLIPFTAQLQGLEEASLRPHCRVMPTYDNENIPALLGMRQRARVLSLRAVLSLRNGQPEAALGDTLTILRVAKHLQQEPHLITQLLRIAYVKLSFQPIWEGLHAHRWNEQQLSKLQTALAETDLLESWQRSWMAESSYRKMQMESMAAGPLSSARYINELALGNGRVNHYLTAAFIPKAWVYQNLIALDRYYRAQYVDVINPAGHFIDARRSERVAKAWADSPKSPYTMIAKDGSQDFSVQNMRMGHAQSTVDQAFIACGLERYLLAHKAYPERLDDLLPEYAAKLPVDVIDGNPLCYRKTSNTSCLLYAVGWNGTDEGGKVVTDSKQPYQHILEQGNWVWTQSNIEVSNFRKPQGKVAGLK
jgi:hypothetical protein